MDQAESSTNDDLDVLNPEEVACMIMSLTAEKLVTSYDESRRIEDLQQGISAFRDALTLCPPASPLRDEILNRIANALKSRYEELGNITDLEECISLHHSALDLRPPGHPDRSVSLNNLASGLSTRYQMSGDADDLEVCIALIRDALHLRPPGHSKRSISLDNLGSALSIHYANFGNVDELEESIALHREALALCPPSHPDHSSSLNNVGLALYNRYEKLGNAADLDESICLYQSALNLHPPGHAQHSNSLNNLATGLNKRYNELGNVEDLEDCIGLHRDALHLRPPGHPDRSMSLNNLAIALHTRYTKFGHTGDLEVCIGFHREALGLRPPGHPEHLASLNNLGAALDFHYAIFGNTNDLEDSIAFHRDALSICPPSHPSFSTALSSLASILHTRYSKSGNLDDLEECIALHRDALRLRPPGHPDRSMTLTNLASALSDRYWKLNTAEDLDECIAFYHETVDLRPCGHPNHSKSLHRLGDSLMTRHIKMSKPEDFVPALSQIVLGACDSTSYIHDRLTAAILWIEYARAYNHGSIFEAYTTLLKLINRFLIFHPSVELQQTFLASTDIPRSLASDAASAAIEAGKIELAVEFLEQGRALLWSRVDAYKYPLHELRQVKGGEELADRLEVVSSKLEHLSLVSRSATSNQPDSSTTAAILDTQMKEHRILSEEWGDLVGKVREIEGFSHFLQAAPFDVLKSAAEEGPIILVNVSKYRSDAIILLEDKPPGLVNLTEVLLPELRDQKCRSAKEIINTLAYLWDTIVSPIVDHLKDLGIQKGSRIWWCPTAELCALPLHAAGRGKRNLHDIYVSSYTSTLSSLIKARSSVVQPSTVPKLLVVGQPSDLKKVRDEVDIIEKIRPGVDVLFGPDEATREAVLQSLKVHSWVHLACHGLLGEEGQPFHASFKLHEEVDRRLHLLDLTQARLPNAELAFLSACHSAAGGLSTPDESIHLSAALQFCGFKSVVGTLWEMDDEDGPTISEKFYKYMFRNPDQIDFRDSAHALNSAIRDMRKAKVPLDRLAMFVHIGA